LKLISQGKAGVDLRIEGTAIYIGDCKEAKAQNLVGDQMPVEGFAIKTASNRLLIVGHDRHIIEEVGGQRAQSCLAYWNGFLEPGGLHTVFGLPRRDQAWQRHPNEPH
jgi:hypothetical protein